MMIKIRMTITVKKCKIKTRRLWNTKRMMEMVILEVLGSDESLLSRDSEPIRLLNSNRCVSLIYSD